MKKVKQDSLGHLKQVVADVKSGKLTRKRNITKVSQVKDYNDAMAYAYQHENQK